MKKYQLNTTFKQILADTITPVSVYLKIRDKFPNSILLESNDYHTNENSFSYICCNPIASFELQKNQLKTKFPDGLETNKCLEKNSFVNELESFKNTFLVEKTDFKFISNGLFGYISYDATPYFENITFQNKPNSIEIPEMFYVIYQNVIAINHFKNEAYIFCHSTQKQDNILEIEQLIQSKNYNSFSFAKNGDCISNLTDSDFKNQVAFAKKNCAIGNVFQLVVSRRFTQNFQGDDFNVYRALRSINPSPYLFYFDFGNFKIMGSSPEAQLIIKNNVAEIHPIAGTFKRTGNDENDAELAKKLSVDEKENAEHTMLVDLARNDLSRNATQVSVEKYKEIQYFSHVIHLVSKVTGKLKNEGKCLEVVANTFPAGTLSGAPKHKAMQLINEIENTNRTFYGGAIGVMDFEGNFNHAIMIRTFLSKNHQLHYQAGAGVVNDSNLENETQEVFNKLNALNKALEMAENI